MHLMSRLIAKLRSQLSKLTVQHNDLKSKYTDDIAKLESCVQIEKKKRIQAQEDKLEKRSTLMH
jgi:hypothetical protein